MAETVAHIELKDVGKRFGGVRALREIDLSIERGSIHALVGENGAGKSTLGRIIAGALRPDEGVVICDGRPVHYRSPRDAIADGTTMIAQELLLAPQRSVVDNVLLGSPVSRAGVVSRRGMLRRYRALSEQVGLPLPPNAIVGSLRNAEQQKVEILRALARDARLIVMDEPTARLTTDESRKLFEIVRNLRDRGCTIVYVSHFLDEVLALADVVTVLRDGQLIKTSPTRTETAETLVRAMLGRSMDMTFPAKQPPGPEAQVVLAVQGLCREGIVDNVSFKVRAGEIVGLTGLVGSGRTEVARAIFGADRVDGGEISFAGAPVQIRTPREAKRLGLAMVPESRKDAGLLMKRSVLENISIPHLREVSRLGVVGPIRERRRTGSLVESMGILARLSATVDTLSGGNQQKVLFGKWLFSRPRLLIADEPTRGVDVAAKVGIYHLLASLAEEGMAILLISSEVEEILGLAHRALVMRAGRIVGSATGDSLTEERLMHLAFGTAEVRVA